MHARNPSLSLSKKVNNQSKYEIKQTSILHFSIKPVSEFFRDREGDRRRRRRKKKMHSFVVSVFVALNYYYY
jgi:hypothetical protein